MRPFRHAAQWLHKWLALLIGLQVLAWVLGGVVFAWLPFDAWVKSGDMVRKAVPPPAASDWKPLAEVAALHAPLRAIELAGQGSGVYYRLTDAAGRRRLADARTGALIDAGEARIRALAAEVYKGNAPIAEVTRTASPARRLGIVDETHGKTGEWRVTFADRLGTRLYFDVASGEYLRARNDAWVWYDFFWRLHIMDYSGGEDFNHALIKVLGAGALMLVLSGAVMLCYSRFRRRAGAKA